MDSRAGVWAAALVILIMLLVLLGGRRAHREHIDSPWYVPARWPDPIPERIKRRAALFNR